MSILHHTVTELREGLRRGDFSALEVAQAYLQRIHQVEGQVGAYITLCGETALAQARKADILLKEGRVGALTGIPVAVKDNICTCGVKTTCASTMLKDFIPPYSAGAWERLHQAGCVLLGKTNMDEFGMGSTTENSAFHPTRNPRRLDYAPGGSSGGSAAAVAAGEAPFALGSDTGGSVRQPTALCGVVGMKPTYGLVSRYGLVAFASSLDQIGPITRTVEDNALVLNALAGHDGRDATSLSHAGMSMDSQLRQGVKGLTIGLPKEMFAPDMQGAVRQALEHAAQVLEGLGARVVEVTLPSLAHVLPAYYVLSSAEASSNLARFDGVRYGRRAQGYAELEELYVKSRSEGFGSEVKRRILLGTYVLSAGHYDAYYQKAQQVRTLVMQDFHRAFETCHALLGPVTPASGYPLGKNSSPVETYRGDIHTVAASMAGIPALSMPCGRDEEGLPIGLQLMGKALDEPMLYRIAHALEQALGAMGREVMCHG